MSTKQITLITGASSGIGLELARLAAADGRDLVLVARRKDRLEQVKRELEGTYQITVDVVIEDLADPVAPKRIVEALAQKKLQVDQLINNAGFGGAGSFAVTDWQVEAQMIMVNCVALTHLTKLLLPGMLTRKSGRILNISSMAAFLPGPGMAVYYATKAYVQSLSEALASELAGTSVTVTTLNPGPTQSEFATVARVETSTLFNGNLPTAISVAAVGYRAMQRGQQVAIPGFANQISRLLIPFLPGWLVTSYIRRLH